MRTKTCVFLCALLALLLISFVSANDQTQNENKGDQEANPVAGEKYYNGGGWGGNGGGGWGGGWGGQGGGWGGRGGGGWGGRGGGWGGRGGGWGGGGCNYGQCCGGGGYYGGGCRCCNSAQEALAYMQN